MKSLTRTLFAAALCALVSAPAMTSADPKVITKTAINPQAMALLDQSAAAYAKLQGLSMRINGIRRNGEKVTRLSGTLLFSRPDLAKMTLKLNDQDRLYLSDGQQVRLQDSPRSFKIRSSQGINALFDVVGDNPLAMNFMLRELVGGQNPLHQTNANWRNVALLPGNGITLTMVMKFLGPNNSIPDVPITYRLFFNPDTHLLRRVETQSRFRGIPFFAAETVSNVQINPKFAPGTFAFKPEMRLEKAAPR